ncbi:hypothetical protein HYFRA_00012036 [Hymenoscyphus fraxineus]|uniref:Uncharacterized protein n=1 Tax=Hymenoscyphus fraxineus TaxID=746836 RepID=A0A9N9PJR5_9HELO|nr:hypothetical protein HYFRA_00012036 [Hymenoscyphus fraxineus]
MCRYTLIFHYMCEDKSYAVKRCAFARRNNFDCPKTNSDSPMVTCISMCDDCLDDNDEALMRMIERKDQWMRTKSRDKAKHERQDRLTNTPSPRKK